MKTIISIFSATFLIIGCSCYKSIKTSYDKKFHDNKIEQTIEKIIKDVTDIEIDISTEEEKIPELC